MKGIVFDVQRFSTSDGPGIRTTVFFKGCPLRCLWCHNPEAMRAAPEVGLDSRRCRACGACAEACPNRAHELKGEVHLFHGARCEMALACVAACPEGALRVIGRETTVEALLPELLRDAPFFMSSGGGVTLSGGEPTMQAGFAAELAEALQDEGVHVALDTCGQASWDRLWRVARSCRLVLYDVKHVDPAALRALTGADASVVLGNLERLLARGAEVRVRFPLVPGMNDSDAHLADLASTLRRLGIEAIDLIPYHAFAAAKYAQLGRPYPLAGVGSPPPDVVSERVARLRALGLEATVV